jgi:hypothetical protein
MAESLQTSTSLALLLEARLVAWENARKPQEIKLLECYQDVMRIARDDDTTGTGAARVKKSKGLFIGSTRNKVRAARAKITDALFGNGQMPFDTTPTDESLAPFADVMEDIITDQMERGKFKALLKTGVNTLGTYGTGFIFGPFVKKETLTETKAVDGAIKEEKYEFDLPYFELGNTLDVYPDPEAREVESGLGVFWVTMESPTTVAAWKNDKAYKNVDMALIGPGDRGNETGSEMAAQLRGNVQYWFKNDRIKVARFFGKVPASALSGDSQAPTDDSVAERQEGDMVDAIVIMAGGVVVKVVENPYSGKSPVHRGLYEAVEHEMWGVGVAENNAPHQKVTNAAFRLFMEGKGMALLGTTAIDRSKFMPTENFRKFPGKVYDFKPGLSPEEKKAAIQQFVEPDITGGWIDVIRMSEQFSDDDTGITKYTQGDDSSNLNKTATGISMIMSASSLPMKEVIQNIDEMWIEPIVECYIDWNLKYLSPETVQKIHGDEAAQLWAQIKQFGKSSFMSWKATGTASFMQKEVLTNKIRAFSEFALGNPMTAQKIDVTELLQQTWDVMEIGKESPILKAEDGQEEIPEPVKQRMMQVAEQMEQMGQQLQQTQQALQEAEAKAQDEEQKRIKAEIDAKEAKAMLNVEQAMAQAREDFRSEQQATEPKGPTQAAPQQPMVLPDVNGAMSQALAPLAEVMQATQQSTEMALSAIAEQQASLGAVVQQSNAQTAEILAAVLAKMSEPKTTTMQIKSPSGGVYTATKTEA